MSPEQFAAWLGKMGWSDAQAAEQLGVDRQRVFRWRKGQRRIPQSVAKLCALLEQAKLDAP